MARSSCSPLLALLVVACSGGSSPETAVVPETHAPTAPPPEATPVPPPTPPPPALPDLRPPDRSYSAVTLPADVHLDTLATRERTRELSEDESIYGEVTLTWETAAHPDPAVVEAISAWAEHAVPMVSGADIDRSPSCELWLATTSVLSMVCQSFYYPDRGNRISTTDVHTARIEEGRVVPFEMADAIVPSRAFLRAAISACVTEVSERGEEDEAAELCSRSSAHPLPLPVGLAVVFASPNEGMADVIVPIAWSEATDLIRADGPLAALFPGAATHEVVLTGEEQLAARLELFCDVSFAVTSPRPLPELLAAVRALPRERVRQLGVAMEGDRGRLVHHTCARDLEAARTAAQTATELATRLGARAEVFDRPSSVYLYWLRAERQIALRDRGAREGSYLASIPEGTIVLGAIGQLPEGRSGYGVQGSWSRVWPTSARDGWAAGRYLRPWAATIPAAESLLASLPDAARAAAARDALVGSIDGTSGRPLWFVVASAEGSTHVGVADSDTATRAPIAAPALSTAPGVYDDLRFVQTGEGERTAYVLLATRLEASAPGMSRWHLFAPGAAQPGWTLDAPTSGALPEDARAELTTDVTRGGHRWLAQFRMPDRSMVRVRAAPDGTFVEERARR